MRRKGLWLSVLATALIAGSASAATMTIQSNAATTLQSGGVAGWGLNWGSFDFSGNEFDHIPGISLSNTSYRWAGGTGDTDNANNPSTSGDAWTPGAGGGQNYDAEAVVYYFNSATNALHLGLITGFNPFGEVGDGASPYYRSGDLFVSLGTTGEYHLALGTALGSPSAAGTNLEGSTRAGNAWYDSNPVGASWMSGDAPPMAPGLLSVSHTTSPNLSVANPYRVDVAQTTEVGLLSNNVDYAYTRLSNFGGGTSGPNATGIGNNNSERWFYEYRVIIDPSGPLGSLLENLTNPNGGIGLHWTMGCGNDYIDKNDNTPFDNVVPVPAAAPLGMLGMGLIALVRRVRRRPEC